MSPDEMRASISKIRRRYFNLVRLVVTSDDIARCKEILHDIDDIVLEKNMDLKVPLDRLDNALL